MCCRPCALAYIIARPACVPYKAEEGNSIVEGAARENRLLATLPRRIPHLARTTARRLGKGNFAKVLYMPQPVSAAHDPSQNYLLAALPEADFARLKVGLKLVPMPLGEVLYESGSQQRRGFFSTTPHRLPLFLFAGGGAPAISGVGDAG